MVSLVKQTEDGSFIVNVKGISRKDWFQSYILFTFLCWISALKMIYWIKYDERSTVMTNSSRCILLVLLQGPVHCVDWLWCAVIGNVVLAMTDVHAPMRMKVREREVAAKLLGLCQMLQVSMTTPHTAPLPLNSYIFIFFVSTSKIS